ncbi:hypothetical protein HII36_12340 [Nonomuraea sp. NN258]|nr:hypothetical protein [Nonomuraea antri]
MDVSALERFVVQAKAATYVGGGSPAPTQRAGEHLLTYGDGPWSYQDSYVGGADFCGQETVRYHDVPVWSMIYSAHLIRPEVLDGATAGRVIKQALTAMYAEGRFLGGWTADVDAWRYADTSTGDVTRFTGLETIERDGERLYELRYLGGTVRE